MYPGLCSGQEALEKLLGTMARLVASHITCGRLAEGMSLSRIDLHRTGELAAQRCVYDWGLSFRGLESDHVARCSGMHSASGRGAAGRQHARIVPPVCQPYQSAAGKWSGMTHRAGSETPLSKATYSTWVSLYLMIHQAQHREQALRRHVTSPGH